MSTPNILMIMADQLAAPAVGAYGHPVVQTPNIDRLAKSGVLFESGYCGSPLCVPSRASLVTGRHPSRVGSFDNGCELSAQIPTCLHHLRRAGYCTIASGKLHFIGPDQLHGFEERLTTDIYPASFSWTPDWRNGAYFNPGSSVEKLRASGVCQWSMQLDYDEQVQFRALERLRSLAADDERPFFCCVSFTHPHQPYTITAEYWDRYDHDAIDPPAAREIPLADMHPYDRWLQVHHGIDQFPPDAESVRKTRHAYYGMISYIDDKVGELLAELRRLGLENDTVVLFCSDHGDMLGEHGMWSKRTFREWSARVPLVCSYPGRWDGGRRVAEPVSLVDLFPTLLEIAQVDDLAAATAEADGSSLVPLLDGDGPDPKRAAVCEYCGEGIVHPMRMIRRGPHKYVFVKGEEPLLFDLEQDPLERTNLRGHAELATLEAELREELLADWDPDAIERRVLASQQERLLINDALSRGTPAPWDYQPPSDPSTQYVRD